MPALLCISPEEGVTRGPVAGFGYRVVPYVSETLKAPTICSISSFFPSCESCLGTSSSTSYVERTYLQTER